LNKIKQENLDEYYMIDFDNDITQSLASGSEELAATSEELSSQADTRHHCIRGVVLTVL